jgi:hypothetical protein
MRGILISSRIRPSFCQCWRIGCGSDPGSSQFDVEAKVDVDVDVDHEIGNGD